MGSHHHRTIDIAPVTSPRHSSPESVTEAGIALNIASRREELHRNTPAAITLSASCVFAFHEEIHGALHAALRSRSESYAREQGTGKRALTWDDVCELVIAGGAEGRRAVRALIAPVVSVLDGSGSGVAVSDAAAEFLAEAADVPNALLLGKSDSEIRREIREAREKLRVFEAAIEARNKVTAPFVAIPGIGGRQ